MKSSMRKPCLRAYSRTAQALPAHVLLRGRDPQIGNGFHGLTMKYGFSLAVSDPDVLSTHPSAWLFFLIRSGPNQNGKAILTT